VITIVSGAATVRECRRRALWVGTVAATGWLASGCADPSARAITECIAPAGAGGGWDLTCRSVGRLLSQLGLVTGNVQVTNMPGAGGGIALVHTVTQREDDRHLLVAASPSTTLNISQRRYGSLTEHSVRWVAAVGAEYGALAVRADAPWPDLRSLMQAWSANPSSITVSGGSAVASQDHMKVLLLAREAGVDPRQVRYIPFDGGGEAMTTMLGGFVDVMSGDVSEMMGQLEAGAIRVIAVLAPERLGGEMSDVPTAREEGYDVEWVTWRGFYAPRDIPDTTYARWVTSLDRLAHSPEWDLARAANRLEPFYLAGDEFTEFVGRQVDSFRSISHEIGLLP
jgi:putative tricarboxylic transport membrane protein